MARKPAKPKGCSVCAMRGWVMGREGFAVECACRAQEPVLARALRKAAPRRLTGQPITGWGSL